MREQQYKGFVVDLDPYGTPAPFIDAAVQVSAVLRVLNCLMAKSLIERYFKSMLLFEIVGARWRNASCNCYGYGSARWRKRCRILLCQVWFHVLENESLSGNGMRLCVKYWSAEQQ
jgi:hypothetical protein